MLCYTNLHYNSTSSEKYSKKMFSTWLPVILLKQANVVSHKLVQTSKVALIMI